VCKNRGIGRYFRGAYLWRVPNLRLGAIHTSFDANNFLKFDFMIIIEIIIFFIDKIIKIVKLETIFLSHNYPVMLMWQFSTNP